MMKLPSGRTTTAARRLAVMLTTLAASVGVVALASPRQATAATGCPAGTVQVGSDCSVTFTYTGAPQTFTVPAGVSEMSATVDGADGGAVWLYPQYGGPKGGEVKGTFAVTGGQVYTVVAGGLGGRTQQNTNDGGTGGYGGGAPGGHQGAGGGGGSYLYGPGGQTLLIGGGGGGDAAGPYGGPGGKGGGTDGGGDGATGSLSSQASSGETPGGGGKSGGHGGAPGVGGTENCCGVIAGNPGTRGSVAAPGGFGPGGSGGDPRQDPPTLTGYGGGGGGGGGAFGGGGGGGGYYSGGGGGGGAGFISSSATNTASTPGGAYGPGHVVLSFPLLRASFTVSKFAAGEYQFVSTAASYGSPIVTTTWDFADPNSPSAGSGTTVSHTYTAPGTYAVKMTATNQLGETATTTQTIDVAAPTLGASISFPGWTGAGNPQPDPGTDVAVQLDVSAGDGVGALSGVTFTGASPLTIAPTGALTVGDGPTPVPVTPLTLPPNTSRSYLYHLHAVKLGPATLTSTLTGHDAAARAVTAQASQSLQVGQSLTVTLSATPPTLQVALDDHGKPVPQPFTVTVKVTNPHATTLDDVRLDPSPILERLQPGETFDPIKVDTTKPPPNLSLGALGSGQSASVDIPFVATYDGDMRVNWTATAKNPDNPSNRLGGVGRVVVHVNPKTLITLDITNQADGPFVKAGKTWDAALALQNVSNSVVVHLDPITPTLAGNAANGNPFDVNNPPQPIPLQLDPGSPPVPSTSVCDGPGSPGSPPSYENYYLPWMGTLGPGDPKALESIVQTLPNGPTRSTLTYTISGTVDLPGGTTRPLTAADVKITPSDGKLDQGVDVTDPPPPPSDFPSWVANFSIGFAQASCSWWAGTFAAVGGLAHLLYAVSIFGNPAPLRIVQAVAYGIEWYQTLTPSEKASWITTAATIIWKQKKGDFQQTLKQVNDATEQWWLGIINAWNTGDGNAMARFLGSITGNVSLEVASWLIHVPAAEAYISLAKRKQQLTVATRVKSGIAALKIGDDLAQTPEAISALYGVGGVQAADISLLAQRKNLLIALRQRSASALKWVEEWHAVLKPSSIFDKTVVDLDRYLGYAAADEGLVILKEPISPTKLKAVLDGISDPGLARAVQQRYDLRVSEWTQNLAKYQKYEREGLPVYFDTEGNGIVGKQGELRQFALTQPADRPAGQYGRYYRVEYADAKGILRPVTGDIDIVGITHADGSELTAAERLDIYENLRQIVGMQHPETLTWLRGEEKQLQLLANHVGPDAEKLLVFDPAGGARVATINPKWTFFDAANQLKGVWYDGAYKTPQNVLATLGHVALPGVTSGFNAIWPWVGVESWILKVPPPRSTVRPSGGAATTPDLGVIDNHGKLGTCPWQLSKAPSAGVLFRDGSGGLIAYTPGSGWNALDARACTGSTGAGGGPIGADHIVRLLPQSATTSETPAGALQLTLLPLSAAAPSANPATTPWFAVGDPIVVEPGSPTEEVAYVTGLNPLTLDHPLAHPHANDTLVSVLPSTPARFIKAAYADFLHRPPTASEIAAGEARLAHGEATSTYALSLANTTEYVGVLVDRFYTDTLGRPGEPAGRAYWINQLVTHARTVARVAAEFYASPEYYKGIGGNTDTSWITDLYSKLLGRAPDASGLTYWRAQITSSGRTDVADRFYQSVESRDGRVSRLYGDLLGRPPDPSGRDYWAGRILTAGDVALASFLGGSTEYYGRAQVRFYP